MQVTPNYTMFWTETKAKWKWCFLKQVSQEGNRFWWSVADAKKGKNDWPFEEETYSTYMGGKSLLASALQNSSSANFTVKVHSFKGNSTLPGSLLLLECHDSLWKTNPTKILLNPNVTLFPDETGQAPDIDFVTSLKLFGTAGRHCTQVLPLECFTCQTNALLALPENRKTICNRRKTTWCFKARLNTGLPNLWHIFFPVATKHFSPK